MEKSGNYGQISGKFESLDDKKSEEFLPEYKEIIFHINYTKGCFFTCFVENDSIFRITCVVCYFSDAEEDNESKDRLFGLQSAESENETRCSSLSRRSRKVRCN